MDISDICPHNAELRCDLPRKVRELQPAAVDTRTPEVVLPPQVQSLVNDLDARDVRIAELREYADTSSRLRADGGSGMIADAHGAGATLCPQIRELIDEIAAKDSIIVAREKEIRNLKFLIKVHLEAETIPEETESEGTALTQDVIDELRHIAGSWKIRATRAEARVIELGAKITELHQELYAANEAVETLRIIRPTPVSEEALK